MRKLSSLIVAGSLLLLSTSAFAQSPNTADEEYYPTYQGGQPQEGPPPQQQQYAQDPDAYPQQQPQAQPVAAQPGAQGQFYAYVGAHPVPHETGTGICREQGAHFHEYPPFDQYVFRESNGYFYFVGDLGDFGYDGQVWAYGSNHPIPVEFGGGYCYIPWQHRHHFAPPQQQMAYYSYVDNYYMYTGSYDPYYYDYRDGYYGYYNGYYQTNYYGGRYWSVRPRAVYRPTVVVGRGLYYGGRYVPPPPGHSHLYTGGAGVRVYAPRITIAPPARVNYAPPRVVWQPTPRVGVSVGVGVGPARVGGSVYVAPPSRGYVAPAPSRPVYSPYSGPARTYSPPPARVVAPPSPTYNNSRRYTPPPAPVRSVPAPRR